MSYKKIFFIVLCVCTCLISSAEIRLPNFFSDHMVLQQKESISIFGYAKPSQSVEVSFNKEILKAIARTDGKWSVNFMPMTAGGPFEMIIKGENVVILKDIYIGEVWFCSGQSNMGWTIEKSENGLEELGNANYEEIKLLNVRRSMSSHLKKNIDAKNTWKTCTPENAKGFSAVAYYFGRALYQKYGVPIGLIHSSWGGSSIEAWMNSESLKDYPEKQKILQNIKSIDLNQIAEDYKIDEREYHKFLDDSDMGTKENWQLLSTDYSNWNAFKLPTTWSKAELKQRYGIVWVTIVIELTLEEIKNDLTLSLGRIDNEDITYFNGVQIGGLKKNDVLRNYPVPKELLKVGGNRITIRVKNPLDIGGFRGSPFDLFLETEMQKISLAKLWKYKVATPNVKEPPQRIHPKNLPSSLYNAMLNPFFKYHIKGVIWYQGESNMSRAEEYVKLFPKMIIDWREQWKKDIPFLFVQLPNLANKNNRLPKFREAQKSALRLKNTGMVTSIDIGDDFNIHPKNKKDIGKRLAIVANDLVYGKNLNEYKPIIKEISKDSNAIILVFKDKLNIKGDIEDILGFEISEDGKNYKSARARQIDATTIQINYPNLNAAKNLQYLWKDAPEKVMIYSKHDFPLAPFQFGFQQ